MKKVEFAELLMKKANLPSKEEAKRQVEVFVETLKEALATEEVLVFRGLGTFERKTTKRAEGINPRTGEPIKITPKNYVKFKVGKDLSDRLNVKEEPKKKRTCKRKAK
ncbi:MULTISPECIES: HU family DNA-binding protein [Fusobacterium]|jgi:nucleoid DNA-binding protein|uniref:HU family DNA-binding protein n=1 Tax=Fusobacterium TaxID=848 RepID=UPI0015A66AE5|nr:MULTISPECIES: HU family DNA-binding protein [Fusobacterium]MCF2612322.1 HU family DNA-binding protein [Fusobacterium perfoetens]MDY2981247.1 HU family DNA-binding protein [Fusobacterium sp.]